MSREAASTQAPLGRKHKPQEGRKQDPYPCPYRTPKHPSQGSVGGGGCYKPEHKPEKCTLLIRSNKSDS
mgnify:FL=1